MSLAETRLGRCLYSRVTEVEHEQEQIATLVRSNTDFRGPLEQRIRELLGAYGIARSVVEYTRTQHPELLAELDFEQRRAALWLGAGRLADDVVESEGDDTDEQSEP